MSELLTLNVKNSIIRYEPRDAETARMIQAVCSKTEELVYEKWHLSLPEGTQVHVMRSWLHFPFLASNWIRKILLALSLPLWSIQARRLWAFSGGWALPYPRHPAIGVKPPELLQISDRSMGRQIFVDDMDDMAKVQMIACHELTHASTARLRLPAWLNEGMAMVAVDDFFGYQSVQPQTLSSLRDTQPKIRPQDYRQLRRAHKQTLVYLYVRGYWITRFLDGHHPEILCHILSKRHKHSDILTILSEALQIPVSDFWQRIDDIVYNYFTKTITIKGVTL